MRHTLWGRVVAVLFGFWFAAALTEPAALHACPMHGGVHGASHAAGDASSHATMQHGSRDDDAGAPAPHQATTCTCLGDCCGVVAVTVPSVTGHVLPCSVVHVATTRAAPAPAAHRPTEPEHARPPSQGPPAALA